MKPRPDEESIGTALGDEEFRRQLRGAQEQEPVGLLSELSGSAQSGSAGAAARAESTAALSTRADGLAADLRWTLKHLRREPMPLADLIPLLQDAADLLELVTQIGETVEQWAQAYPLDMFPEPDFKLARELLECGQWQPIESAPKDGTEILVPYPRFNAGNDTNTADSYHTIAVKWNGLGWDTGFWMLHAQPKHWQPLPTFTETPARRVSLDCVSASNMRHVITRVHELMNGGRR